MRDFTMSPMLTMPTSRSASTTGMWRIRRTGHDPHEVVDAVAARAGGHVGGHERRHGPGQRVVACAGTGVAERPHDVALGQDAGHRRTGRPGPHDQGADVVPAQQGDGVGDGRIRCDAHDVVSLAVEDVLDQQGPTSSSTLPGRVTAGTSYPAAGIRSRAARWTDGDAALRSFRPVEPLVEPPVGPFVGHPAGRFSAAPIDVDRARSETPGCAHVAHFNHAGCSLAPQPVLDAQADWLAAEAVTGGYELAADRGRRPRRRRTTRSPR